MNFSAGMGPASMEQSSVTECTTVLTTVTRQAVSKVCTKQHCVPCAWFYKTAGELQKEEACTAPLCHNRLLPAESCKPFWQWGCLGEMVVLTRQTARLEKFLASYSVFCLISSYFC